MRDESRDTVQGYPDQSALDLLDRVLAGELSPDDAAATGLPPAILAASRQFLAERPVSLAETARLRERLMRQLADEAEGVPRHPRVSRPLWRGEFKGQSLRGGISKGQPLPRSLWPTLAAAALGLLAIMVGWHVIPRLSEPRATAVSTYTTGNGQRANITLPDGNTVVLNVASRLDVPVDYANGNRTLRLNGEALFTVLHQTATPLTVVAGTATARVLGTSFVVRHYATDTLTTVAVREGKVAVRSLVLTSGRQVAMSQSGMTQVRPVDPAQFSFAAGVLTLEGIPLPEAIPELDRWYGVDIRLGSPSLTTRRIIGNLTAGSLTDVTALLEMTFDVRVVRDGRTLTLIPR